MMASKPKKPATPEAVKYPRKAIPFYAGKSKEETCRNYAMLATSSDLAAFRVITRAEEKSGIGESIDVPTLLEELRHQAAAVNRGDLTQVEAMLMNQATALQSLFARLAERGMGCELAPAFEANMRMALRAQSQCRATLETLATIKNPPIVYARQANVTTGPQQINNGTATPSREREIETEQTQLSGGTHELLPDARASGNASRVNPALETLGEIDRAEIRRG
jgi:hypothetical protein